MHNFDREMLAQRLKSIQSPLSFALGQLAAQVRHSGNASNSIQCAALNGLKSRWPFNGMNRSFDADLSVPNRRGSLDGEQDVVSSIRASAGMRRGVYQNTISYLGSAQK
jgi:hypothetical protein